MARAPQQMGRDRRARFRLELQREINREEHAAEEL